jgi:hypothetical protein
VDETPASDGPESSSAPPPSDATQTPPSDATPTPPSDATPTPPADVPATPQQSQPGEAVPPMPMAPDAGGGNKRRTWLIVGLFALAALIVIVIIAIVAGGGGNKNQASASSSSSSSPSATGPPPDPPQGLAGKAKGPFKVVLSWDQSPVEVLGYQVTRNGQKLPFVAYPATTITDDAALPGQHYSYAVETAAIGGVMSTGARVDVETPLAPPSTARLSGVFNVHMTVTSKSGVSGFPDTETAGWRFKPQCPEGTCKVKWSDLSIKSLTTILGQQPPGTYSGSASTNGQVVCSGVHVTSSLTIHVHVDKGGVVHNHWVATKISGSVSQSTASQLGCVSSYVNWTFTGSILH